MTFTGDASQVPISNIVQALAMNGQEGVLTLWTARQHWSFRILRAGIRPLAVAAHDTDLLRRVVVKERILTDTEFGNAFLTWNAESEHPGDFLVKRRLLAAEQVESNLRRQFEELIFEVFSLPDMTYEFLAGAEWIDHEIFEPDGLGRALVYNVNAILMESARRDDDWSRIESEIHSAFDILVSATGELPQSCPETVSCRDGVYEEIRELLGSYRTIDAIISESPFSPYEVSNVLFQMKSQGLVRSLGFDEKEEQAEKMRRMMKTKEAVGLYQSLIADDPRNFRIRQKLLSLLERTRWAPDLLVEEYASVAELYSSTDPARSLEYVDKILELSPDEIFAYELKISLLAATGHTDAAINAVRVAARLIRSSNRLAEGCQIFERILQFLPLEPYVLHELAELARANGDVERATECLLLLTDLYQKRGDKARLNKTCRTLVEIDPSLRQKLQKFLVDPKGKRRRTRQLVRVSVWTTLAVAILGGLTYVGMLEMSSRDVFAQVEETVAKHRDLEDWDAALAAVYDFQKSFPWSTRCSRGDDLLVTIREERQAVTTTRASRAETATLALLSALGKAEGLLSQGAYDRALEILRSVLDEHGNVETPETTDALAKIRARITTIEEYFARARAVASRLTAARNAQNAAAAHSVARELIERYPYSPEAASCELPVVLQTSPADASVVVGGRVVAEETPIVLNIPHRQILDVTVRRPGYETTEFRLEPLQGHLRFVRLEKAADWIVEANGPIDARPAVYGSNIIVPTRNGSVFSVSADGSIAWTYQSVDRSDLRGGCGTWDNLVFVGASDGKVHILSSSSGQPASPPFSATPDGLWIRSAPSRATPDALAAFNCADRAIAAIDLAKARTVWVHRSDKRLIGTPGLDGAFFRAATVDGTLLRLDSADGSAHQVADLGTPITRPPTYYDGRAYLVVDDRYVQVVDLNRGEPKWKQQVPGTVTASVAVAGLARRLFVAAGETLHCLSDETGAILWSNRAPASIETTGDLLQGHYYVSTNAGHILRWGVGDGAIEWEYRILGAREDSPRGITCPGIVSKGRFLQGADDGRLYALSVD